MCKGQVQNCLQFIITYSYLIRSVQIKTVYSFNEYLRPKCLSNSHLRALSFFQFHIHNSFSNIIFDLCARCQCIFIATGGQNINISSLENGLYQIWKLYPLSFVIWRTNSMNFTVNRIQWNDNQYIFDIRSVFQNPSLHILK